MHMSMTFTHTILNIFTGPWNVKCLTIKIRYSYRTSKVIRTISGLHESQTIKCNGIYLGFLFSLLIDYSILRASKIKQLNILLLREGAILTRIYLLENVYFIIYICIF